MLEHASSFMSSILFENIIDSFHISMSINDLYDIHMKKLYIPKQTTWFLWIPNWRIEVGSYVLLHIFVCSNPMISHFPYSYEEIKCFATCSKCTELSERLWFNEFHSWFSTDIANVLSKIYLSIYLSFVNMHWTIADESKFMDSIWVQLFFILFHFFVFSLFLSRHRKTIYDICQFIDAIHVRKREREFKLQLIFGCNSQVIYIRKCHFCSALKITFATILHAIMICSSGFECILPSIASHIYRMPCKK